MLWELIWIDSHLTELRWTGIGGSGRSSTCKLAAFMGDYDLYQIEVSKNYGFNEWREDIQKLFRQAGINGIQTVFLFGDHQIKVIIFYS